MKTLNGATIILTKFGIDCLKAYDLYSDNEDQTYTITNDFGGNGSVQICINDMPFLLAPFMFKVVSFDKNPTDKVIDETLVKVRGLMDTAFFNAKNGQIERAIPFMREAQSLASGVITEVTLLHGDISRALSSMEKIAALIK